jgi:hypothetical protein
MPHLPSTHHETSKHDSPNETKIKEKQNKTVPDSNSNLAKSMTHHNQTKELITSFLRERERESSNDSEAVAEGARGGERLGRQRDGGAQAGG